MPKAIHEGTRVRFIDTDHPEDLAYFLRRVAEGMSEAPEISVNNDVVEIDCSGAPRMLTFLEKSRDRTLLPYIEGEYLRFRERGPVN